MPISSVIVRCIDSDAAARLAGILPEITGVSLEHREDSSLVVVIEAEGLEQEKGIWDKLESHQDVARLELIYSNFEDLGGAEK